MSADVFNPETQEQDAQAKQKADELAVYERREDIKWLMGNERGRRIMWQLLDRSGMRREPMTGNSQTFYNLGAVAIGRELEAEIFAYCAELYTQMITENSK